MARLLSVRVLVRGQIAPRISKGRCTNLLTTGIHHRMMSTRLQRLPSSSQRSPRIRSTALCSHSSRRGARCRCRPHTRLSITRRRRIRGLRKRQRHTRGTNPNQRRPRRRRPRGRSTRQRSSPPARSRGNWVPSKEVDRTTWSRCWRNCRGRIRSMLRNRRTRRQSKSSSSRTYR